MSLSDQSKRPRLLVADDDPTVRLLAQSVLAAAVSNTSIPGSAS